MTDEYIRIVPPLAHGMTPTKGTQVFAGGQLVGGVTRIELVADVSDGVWRAVIHTLVKVDGEIHARIIGQEDADQGEHGLRRL